MFIITITCNVAPSFYCCAMFCEKYMPDKALMSLAVIQDLPSSKEVHVCVWLLSISSMYMLVAVSRRSCQSKPW